MSAHNCNKDEEFYRKLSSWFLNKQVGLEVKYSPQYDPESENR